MTFQRGQMRVFDRSGAPLGALTGYSITGPRSYRLNEVDDMAFTMPRNDGTVPIISAATPPTVVSIRTASGSGQIVLPDPSGTAVDDVLIAAISFDRDGSQTTVTAPAGWSVIASRNNGTSVGVRILGRVVRAGDPSNRAFASTAGAGISGAIITLRGVRHDLVRGARVTPPVTAVSSGTSHACPGPASLRSGITLFAWAGSASASWTVGDLTEHVDVGMTGASLAVGSRIDTAQRVGGEPVTATSSASLSSAMIAVSLYPVAGTYEMLAPDNLVYVENETTMPGWGGVIDDPLYTDDAVQVRCLGGLSLLSAISTDLIEQDEGEAYAIAERLVRAANAKQAAHGDLVMGIVRDGSKPNHGKFSYEGEIVRGIQQLASGTLSEFYMESSIDPATGYLRMTLHWGAEYDTDRTSVVLRDGAGGNLTPGTAISFAGAERANYARLLGAETDIAEWLDYDAVLTLTENVVPEVSASIPEPEMPGARRRERLDLSVDWGLPEARQKALARTAQDRYLTYYKRFLYAFHERFGMPFLDGFDWSGPEADQFRKLSGRHYRTTSVLGFLGQRDVVTDWDPEEDADVTLEGWYHKRDIAVPGIVGVAYDHTETQYRWMATATDVRSIRAVPDHDVSPATLGGVNVTSGERCIGIASHASEPTTLWVMTQTSSYTIVRQWDVVAAGAEDAIVASAIIREWSVPDPTLTDLAVAPEEGLCWTSTSASGDIQKRDINSGLLLDTYATSISVGRGISVSGPIVYIIGGSGKVEMRFTEDGEFAATHETPRSAPRGLFVDPRQSEVWITYEGMASVYSAAIAIDELDGPGPIDGAPGFEAISKARFVRIVMADNRDVGEPQETRRGIKSIIHRNQFGRYVDGKWKEWGATTWGDGTTKNYNHVNCGHSASAMLLDRHTRGNVRHTPPEMRKASGDRSGGSGLDEIVRGWKNLGHHIPQWGYNVPWSTVMRRIRQGKGAVLLGDMDRIPERFKCQAGYGGNHAVYVHDIDGKGRLVVHDPLCRGAKRIPAEYMRRYTGKFSGTMGRAQAAFSRDTTGKEAGPSKGSQARSFFIVWSEGKWQDEFVPNAPGEPVTVVRRWDVGDQRSGFKERKKVSIANPEQVIHGEEGRVGDWDPVTMGYGRKGESFYRAKDGTQMRATGWHLVPWDIPLETFALGLPDWPEGEEYLRDALTRFNREQGAQVLGVVNVEGVWQHIRLGARITLQATLQGPHPTGISGAVRVVAFTPDETTGTCQVLCEWMGAD